MKKSHYFSLFSLALALLLYSCQETEEPDRIDDLQFLVDYKLVQPAELRSDGWYVSNPYYEAAFQHRENVQQYEFRNVREDGSKSDVFVRRPNQLTIQDNTVQHRIIIGSPYLGLGISEAAKNQMLAEFQQIIDQRAGQYHKLEVTVIPTPAP
ncbi:hypothetical protein [Arthrospiribacter ruber]|uniref:Uncharacterized protein n=1 Tax=Arthrospiribacter ruber TaxID=2487934 RepID=A0A951IU37_9BACT|nr:hypothetical protein [Arthrospiribacter ruber]MBW3467465.1 hypothetical protein [Arthrospiribacter ruber]